MKKVSIAILCILYIGTLQAQTLKGFVYSTPDMNPVEFANVLVLNLPDSVMVKGVITYTDGQYSVEGIKPGNYYVKASFIGYRPGGTAVEMKEGEKVCTADTILLQEATEELEEVVVTGDLIRAKELVDRTVYEILPEIEKTSTNGYDVLKKIPSVQVDFNNNVTLDGKSNFIIQVDGKQRDKEFLARILPGDIESVEIIHNPSGRYSGDIEGVINVILKKEARVGINGYVGAQLKPIGKPTLAAMASLDYGREKITFYVSAYTFRQSLNNTTISYNRITMPVDPVVDSILDITGTGDFSVVGTGINSGFDYYIDDRNSLSLNYSYRPFTMINNLVNTGDITVDDQLVNTQISESNIRTSSGENNISLFYRKKFKKPIQELILESNYYFFNSSDDNSFSRTLYPFNESVVLDSSGSSEMTVNDRNYFSSRIDYVQPIGVSMRLEAGYEFYVQNMNYNFVSTNNAQSNLYNYAELRNSAYVSYFWNLKKLSLQGTVRIENSQIDINDEYSPHYTSILPNANIMYKMNSKNTFKFTYNRRINRPDVYNLNPFEKLNNDYSFSSGNPYLNPEHKDRLQLTYTLNFKKINFAPYLYHEYYSNQISNRSTLVVSENTGNFAMRSSPENMLTGYEQGIGLNTTIVAFNINGRIYKGHFNAFSDSLTTIQEQDYFSYRINAQAFAPLFKEKINVFAFMNYGGVNHSAQTLSYNPLIYGFGLQQNIKNHSWGIIYILPFSSKVTINKTITETPVIYSQNTSTFDASWFIQVMYSYKFNKGRSIKKADRKSEVESDTKSGGFGR
ncbi:MAG: TonB-dependent receptor [Bacteroidales bacterium]|nr:TonB-dependent receptor [Bacteroidales bacterium]